MYPMENGSSAPSDPVIDHFNRIYDEFQSLGRSLTVLKFKEKDLLIDIDIFDLKKCMKYLSKLEYVLEFVSQSISFFGLQVLVDELEFLFRESIETFRDDHNEEINYDDCLDDLVRKLEKCSYIYIEAPGKCESTVAFLTCGGDFKYDLSVLHDYLNVGSTLQDHECTNLLIKEIEKVATESEKISPYIAIIGPNYMGSTQSAFTLSHKLSVYYFNFENILARCDGPGPQAIYNIFSSVTRYISDCIDMDRSHPDYNARYDDAEDISRLTYPLKTLGFIYVLMKMRALERFKSATDWLITMVQLKGMIIPSLTITDFKEQTKDIDFKKQLIFIDELPGSVILHEKSFLPGVLTSRGYHDLESSKEIVHARKLLNYLKNVSRMIKLPCIIAGSNSKIKNNTGQENVTSYGCRSAPFGTKSWVQVVVRTPNASLRSLSQLVRIKCHEGQIKKLEEFVFSPANKDIDYVRLFTAIYGPDAATAELEPVKKLIDFLIIQAETSLPGIISMCMEELFALLPKYLNDPKGLWTAVNEKLRYNLIGCMREINMKYSRLASLHILTNKSLLEVESSVSALIVDKHLYRYGSCDETTFRLNLKNDAEISKIRLYCADDTVHSDRCHFPEIHQDLFTSLACLNCWKKNSIQNSFMTISGIFKEYLRNFLKFRVKLSQIDQNSLSFKILAHWSICAASHLNLNGEAAGVQVFADFVKNLQPFDIPSNSGKIVEFSGLDELPEGLDKILKRVQVPYLLRFPDRCADGVKQTFIDYLGDFVKFGESQVSSDSDQSDVEFDLNFDNSATKGSIGCKMWNRKALGIDDFLDYYGKACRGNYPLSFLVCCDIQPTLNSAKFEEYLVSETQANVDIYAVRYSQSEVKDLYKEKLIIKGRFAVEAIKTFSEPRGAFILVESKFQPEIAFES